MSISIDDIIADQRKPGIYGSCAYTEEELRKEADEILKKLKRRKTMGVRLDNVIADQRYILECLELLRKIQESGNCHTCDNKECNCQPELGEMIRYNCPCYKEKLSNPIKPDTRYVSDTLTVSFDSGIMDLSGLCVTRKCGEKTKVLKMELGDQADILYYLLTEQMTKAEIKENDGGNEEIS